MATNRSDQQQDSRRESDDGARREAASDREPSGKEGSHDANGARSTIAAFLANLGVALAKFVVFVFTGSASMLAEGVHSVADSANQGLMLWGRWRSHRRPSPRHPFGFGRERYFWAFVVAVVLFSGGSLFALVEGEEKLRSPHEVTSYPWAAGVLVVAMALEGWSLRTASKESAGRRRGDEGWIDFVRRTSIPELAVVLLEDSAALIGLAIALIGTTAAELTGNARFDAMGSIGIGILLAIVAFTLASEMKSMLIGEAASPEDVAAIHAAVTARPGVVGVDELRTEHLGPDDLLVVGTIVVDPDAADDLDPVIANTEAAIRRRVPAARLIYLRATDHHDRRTRGSVPMTSFGGRSTRRGGARLSRPRHHLPGDDRARSG